MKKVITYGTFDLLHEGHINLLKHAKALGDYLIVGVTTDNFDVSRGKINVQQSLMERMEAVKRLGIADEVFPEEYIGQKIDDIKRHGVSIFAIGSDWEGTFDYLKEYCSVVYLPRTEGISSTQLRSVQTIRLGTVGEFYTILKTKAQSSFIDGVSMNGVLSADDSIRNAFDKSYKDYDELLADSDAVYIASRPCDRFSLAERALEAGKHVLIESPITLTSAEADKLFALASSKKLTLFESLKTAFSLAFSRLVLLVKSGLIGEVKSIDATCTSLENYDWLKQTGYHSSFTGWGGVALLPIFKILGFDYLSANINTLDGDVKDIFTKVDFVYRDALATASVGIGIKSEGDLRISGTKGYVYVPSPWWKNGYFEVRFEDAAQNKRYFYENDGDGLRAMLVQFLRCTKSGEPNFYIEEEVTKEICKITERFQNQ